MKQLVGAAGGLAVELDLGPDYVQVVIDDHRLEPMSAKALAGVAEAGGA
jgi:hypothetical protein